MFNVERIFLLNFIVDTYLTFSFVGVRVTTLILLHASNSAQSSNQRVVGHRVPLNAFPFHFFEQCQGLLHASNSAQSSNQRVVGNRVPLNVFRFHVFKQCQSILNASTTVAITVFPRSDNNRFTSFSSPQFHSPTTSSDTEVNL